MNRRIKEKKITKIEKVNRECEVFNIEVLNNNNYFANGSLVHNCDDPNNVKDALKGNSSTRVRDKTNEWWDDVMSSRYRLIENRRRLVCQQRIDSLDLSGHILSKNDPNWVHLNLPMEFEKSRKCITIPLWFTNNKKWEDPRKEEGELLWPAGMPADKLDTLKNLDFKGNPYTIAGQLQQRPTPRGGGIIKEEWFRLWEEREPPEFDIIIQSWDTALTGNANSCYSSCTTWGIFTDKNNIRNIMFLSIFSERIEYPELRKMAVRLYQNYNDVELDDPLKYKDPVDLVLVEAKVSGYSLLQDLMRANVPVFKFNPNKYGDKIGRARIASHMIENGLVWLPTKSPAHKILTQDATRLMNAVQLFPNAESNDIIDSMSQALIYIAQSAYVQNKNDPRDVEDKVIRFR